MAFLSTRAIRCGGCWASSLLRTPTPGAGPAAAWTCGLAAALVEMVSAIATGDDELARTAAATRRDRACELRRRALELAEADMAAYRAVLAARREPPGAGRGRAIREGLAAAAEPPLAIAEIAAEVARLAADAAVVARGGVRGEVETAAVLAAAAATACATMLELNLASQPDDPRRLRGLDLIDEAQGHRRRAAACG